MFSNLRIRSWILCLLWGLMSLTLLLRGLVMSCLIESGHILKFVILGFGFLFGFLFGFIFSISDVLLQCCINLVVHFLLEVFSYFLHFFLHVMIQQLGKSCGCF